MKIRFNWGTGIVAAIVLIVAGLGVLVWIAARQDFDLVDKDYYQKGVNYQKQIDKIRYTFIYCLKMKRHHRKCADIYE